jgi:hypothetical protein
MNKMVALLVVVVCLAGLAVAISLVLRRADSPSADNRVNPDAVDAQKRRVVERMTSNEPHGSVQVTTNVGVSIDLERDWAEYRKSPEGGVALQSIVRGAAQPNVSSDARIKLVQGILAFDDISEEEQEKRIKAVVEIAESVSAPELIGQILKCYPRLSGKVKSNTIARVAIIDVSGFRDVAAQMANTINQSNPDEIKALNEGVAMITMFDKEAASKFIESLSPEVRKLVDSSVGR